MLQSLLACHSEPAEDMVRWVAGNRYVQALDLSRGFGDCSMMDAGMDAWSECFYGVRRRRSEVKLGTKKINIYVF